MFSIGILLWEVEQFGFKYDSTYMEEFKESQYEGIEHEDFNEFPWMMFCLEEREEIRLSAFEIFVNIRNI